MQDVELKQLKLQQKKSRLILEEAKLKIRLRKMRVRQLIELGGLVVKAELDNLPTNTTFGALLTLKSSLDNNPDIKTSWTKIGKEKFDAESLGKTSLILSFTEQPSAEIREQLRSHNLRYNRFRNEWYGETLNFDGLKEVVKDSKHSIEIIPNTL